MMKPKLSFPQGTSACLMFAREYVLFFDIVEPRALAHLWSNRGAPYIKGSGTFSPFSLGKGLPGCLSRCSVGPYFKASPLSYQTSRWSTRL